ncbi:GNAT family N-acetyltransferase [Viridibacillus sp. YIM B01967]|uniref:GNAT family N-acetyltransferase n=1 Tax=Viridibacillus soli TaxID=2798301 RepID=A0ABS1HAS2_9BACL|nr:GNAT family protein [Viridibacillus soli]MBK3496519.1 GNAT family N-acetyltransferase [Viridibacillus soli]
MTTINSNLFYGDQVKLTVAREEDINIMVRWEEDAEYLRNVDTEIALPKTKEKLASEGKSDSNEAYFRLRTIADDHLIGFVTIHSIEWNNRAGLMAIGIGDSSNRNKGYGSDALKLILRYAFHELNLDRVGLEVIEYNKGGIRAYEKVGFQQEGRKRSVVYRDGKRYDSIVMGVLRHEWEAIYKEN